ncbi:ABC transporter ATP-binding protein [Paractinoplanes durhamensis]|uniref:ABC transporter ATP-binding protein n=1 Tax=Paractinoplanes durhamensis TaxID=113563 RepID=A0ABQ3YVY0_9ACTN|nr:ABC transporter ATP-binding protein [Actinoplanes durhamensis]GIE01755.1 ABC transporter ATP-binding protein [Actinoplanes durhamensis]
MTLLRATDLGARHGLLNAVRGVSFDVAEGEILALIGANGAGKTTLLRTLAGAHPLSTGTIVYADEDLAGVAAHDRVRRGIALVPEGRKLFPEMTVEENLLVAGHRARPGRWNLDTILEAFPALRPLRGRLASRLSGGQQQATAIARALMTNPRLLLIDEVSLGLSPKAVEEVYANLAALHDDDATVVLVEQDLNRALSTAGRVICLLEGRIVLDAPTAGLTRDEVVTAYFGFNAARQP